jgi:hypothetical protein
MITTRSRLFLAAAMLAAAGAFAAAPAAAEGMQSDHMSGGMKSTKHDSMMKHDTTMKSGKGSMSRTHHKGAMGKTDKTDSMSGDRMSK